MKCFIAPLPGETLYSCCAYQHFASASRSAAGSAIELLGSAHATRQVDFPTALIRLPFLISNDNAGVIAALRFHTIAGYYWPFLKEAAKREIVDEIIGEYDPHWRRRLCAQSRSRPFSHPLKWCEFCAKDDELLHGRSYWHVQHQLPLSFVCATHGTPLHVAQAHPKSWISVKHANIDQQYKFSEKIETGNLAAQLGQAICLLDSIEIGNLRYAVLLKLRDMGVIMSIRAAKHHRIPKWFKASVVADWCLLTNSELGLLRSGDWIMRLLWRRRVSHPILWVVLWMALDHRSNEEAVAEFLNSVNGINYLSHGQLSLFSDDILTMRAPQHVRDTFMESQSYAEVMGKLNVTRGDIVHWLETDVDLRQDWREYLRLGRQAECEAVFRNAIKHVPDLGRQYLEKNHNAEMKWLREHAPQKLLAMLRSLPQRGAVQRTLFEGIVR
jgi:hypothetical protein